MTRARGPGGFTLMEVLVGIVLLASFLAGVYTVVVGTLVAKRKIGEAAAVYTAGPRILDLVEKDLRAVYFHGVADGRAFKAKRESRAGAEVTDLDMVTTRNSKVSLEIDGRQVRSDVTEVGYRLRDSRDHPGLLELYRREQFFFDDKPTEGGQYYLVYDRVRAFTIDFFERPKEGETTSSRAKEDGVEAWDAEDKGELPFAARITLVLAPPPELSRGVEDDARQYRFVRWVLLPTAYDLPPEEDKGPAGPGGPGGPGRPGR